jgi:hypothetical protein
MTFAVGSLVKARGREWVVLPESADDLLVVRFGEDDPLAPPCLDERSDREGQRACPKMFGYLAKVWSHDAWSSKRNVMIR